MCSKMFGATAMVVVPNRAGQMLPIKLDVGGSNNATKHTAPSCKAFDAFCTRCEVEVNEDNPIVGYATHLILDENDKDS